MIEVFGADARTRVRVEGCRIELPGYEWIEEELVAHQLIEDYASTPPKISDELWTITALPLGARIPIEGKSIEEVILKALLLFREHAVTSASWADRMRRTRKKIEEAQSLG